MTVYGFLNRLIDEIIKFIYRPIISFFNKQRAVVIDLFRNGLRKYFFALQTILDFYLYWNVEIILLRLNKKRVLILSHTQIIFSLAYDNYFSHLDFTSMIISSRDVESRCGAVAVGIGLSVSVPFV